MARGTEAIFFLVSALVCFVIGALALHFGFENLQEAQRVTHLWRVPAGATISGETMVKGEVVPEDTVRAPRVNQEVVYYRHQIEKEHRDSEGNRSWRTERVTSHLEPFWLEDESGRLPVLPLGSPEVTARQVQRQVQGQYRHTIHVIEPGETAVVMGYTQVLEHGMALAFAQEGAYVPTITTQGLGGIQTSRMNRSILVASLGLLFLMFSVLLFLRVFRVHNVSLSLAMLTAVAVLAMLSMGLRASQSIVEERYDLVERTGASTQDAFDAVSGELGVESPLWHSEDAMDALRVADAATRRRLQYLQAGAASLNNQTREALNRFPERIFYRYLGGYERLPRLTMNEHYLMEQPPVDGSSRFRFVSIIVYLLVAGGTVGVAVFGFRRVRLKRLVEHMPTTSLGGVTFGLNEVQAKVESTGHLLEAPVTKRSCVYYKHQIREKRERSTHTTVHSRSVPFIARDAESSMEVLPDGAEVITSRRTERRYGNITHTEWVLLPGDEIYLLGEAQIHHQEHDRLRFSRGDGGNDRSGYLISDYTEDDLLFMLGRQGIISLGLSVCGMAVLGFGLFMMVGSLGTLDFFLATALSCAYLVFCFVVLLFNDLVFLRQRVRRCWANIDVALKKRFDLIGNLVPMVKAIASHERELFETTAALRSAGASGTRAVDAESSVALGAQAAGGLLALREAYPELKSNEQAEKLMGALRDVENEIALMRQGYNDAVERYNTRIAKVPEVFVAVLTGMRRELLLNELEPVSAGE